MANAVGDHDAARLNEEVADRLVVEHMRLAGGLSRRFVGRGEPREDLEQVAMVALVGAARRYDPGHEVRFSTFATVCILGELKRHLRDRGWWVRPPRRLHDLHLRVGEANAVLAQQHGRSSTVAEIAAYLGVDEEEVLEAQEAGRAIQADSLDAAAEPGGRTLIDTLADGPDDIEAMLDLQVLRARLPTLSAAEQLAVRRYYFDGRTQAAIGQELGVSQMQVSRILGRVTRTLRNEL